MGGWGGGVYGCVVGVPCMHTNAYAHTQAYMNAHMHMHVKHDKHDQHGCLHVGGHLQFLYMYTCVCVCMCVHAHVCDTPKSPRHPQPPALPRAAGSPKHQNSINPELIGII